jgi:hypothetical protein
MANPPPPESKKLIQEYSKLLPMLTGENFFTWNQDLRDLQYYAEWDADIIDMEQVDPNGWDGQEENDAKVKLGRRTAHAVIKMKLSRDVKHLALNVRPGDAKGLYRNIFRRFCRLTPGAVQTMREEIRSYKMERSGLTVEPWMTKIQEKFQLLMKIEKRDFNDASKRELIGLILNGALVPEFTPVIMTLKMRKINNLTLEETQEAILDFAMDFGVLEVTRGTQGGNGKATALVMAQKVCFR